METLAAIGVIVLLWWWVARRPGPGSTPPPSPTDPARRPGFSAATPPQHPATNDLDEHVRRREDAAFVEGMVVGHYVWPRPVDEDRTAPDPLDRAELEELALRYGGDDPEPVDPDELDDGLDGSPDDPFDDGYDDETDDW